MQSETLKILLIEHDPAGAQSVCAMLGQIVDTKTNVTSESSLEEALARLRQEHFDVLLLEFFLPDGAGLPNITFLEEEAPHVPIIVFGAADDETLAFEVVHAGAQDYLVKSQLSPRWLMRSIRYGVERHAAEAALLDAKEKYHAIFDRLVEGIFQTSPDGHYLLANAALARIYGYTSPEELMNSVTDIGRILYVQPGRREQFIRLMQEHDTISGFESQIFRKDGSIIWISENCRAIRDAHGKLLYFEGTVEDITQRQEAELKLRDSESLYHSLVETLPQNIFRKDLHERFTFANKQFCRTLGRKLEDIVGKTDFDFFPADLAAKYQHDDHRVMTTGSPLYAVEVNQITGKEKTYVQVVKIPLRDATGQIIGLQGIFWDITKERQMEENLKNSESLYHSLVETMPQAVFRRDLQGRFTFVNQPYCAYHQLKPEELLGKTDYDFYPKASADKFWADDLRVMERGESVDIIEESQPVGAKEKRYHHVIKTPLRGVDGKVIGLQGIFWDITEQKLADERIWRANAELARSREQLRLKNAQMEEDLKMAGEIQLTLLPQQSPVFPRGVSPEQSAFKFTNRYHPSGTVGGDFYSLFSLSETEAAVFICDVAGHGVKSALVTAMIRALVEELRPLAHEPGKFMTKLNSELFTILKHAGTPVLTTAFYLVADAISGRMLYTNAGHPKPFLLRRKENKVETLRNATGQNFPALGLFEKPTYQTSETLLEPNDLIMLFTDGLFEVYAPNDDLYTEALLAEATQQRLTLPAAELFEGVLSEVRSFAQNHEFTDDVCLVGMEYSHALPDK